MKMLSPYSRAEHLFTGIEKRASMLPTICVMNPNAELVKNGYLFRNPQASIGHNLCKPICDLYEAASREGFRLVTFDQIENVSELTAVLFLDRPMPWDMDAKVLMGLPIKKYLLLYECEVIRPDNWDMSYHEHFDQIFTWNEVLLGKEKYRKINFSIESKPYRTAGISESDFLNRKLLTLIAGAKLSNHPNQLYSHRVSAIRWYEQNHPKDFDLYGVGWDKSQFPSYQGKVDNKLAVLDRYNFSICYENATGFPGYITEKLLDCLAVRNVAVYGGDQNIESYIPERCYIDIRNFRDFSELHKYISSMKYDEYMEYQSEIDSFYSGQSISKFSCETFAKTILDVWKKSGMQSEPVPRGTLKKLVVCVPYGNEQKIFTRAKAVWALHASHFDNVEIYYFRCDSNLSVGSTSVDDDRVVRVGVDGLKVPLFNDENLYSKTGVWSKSENYLTIYRQVCMYDFLARTIKEDFFMFTATVTSVIDFDGIISALDSMPEKKCFAGMPDTLGEPRYIDPPLKGLSLVYGTNTLLSKDMVILARDRYDPYSQMVLEPNDVWLSHLLSDIPRQALPFYSFIRYRSMENDTHALRKKVQELLRAGTFHFRIKTDPASYPDGLMREDVDPWIMLEISKSILSTKDKNKFSEYLEYFKSAYQNGAENSIPSWSAGHIFRFEKFIEWND